MRAIYSYIFWSLLFLLLSHARLPFSLKSTYFHRFSFSFGGFRNFAIRWSSYPHLKHYRGVRSVCLLSESPAARAFSFSCLILLNNFSAEWLDLHKRCTFSEHCLLYHYLYQNLSCCQDLGNQSIRMTRSIFFD